MHLPVTICVLRGTYRTRKKRYSIEASARQLVESCYLGDWLWSCGFQLGLASHPRPFSHKLHKLSGSAMIQGSWSLRLSCSCKPALQHFALKHGRVSASVFVPLSCIEDKLRLQVLSQDVEVASHRSRHVFRMSACRKGR